LVTYPEEKKSFNSFNNDNPGANAYLQALHVGCSMTGFFSENAYKMYNENVQTDWSTQNYF